MSVRCRDYTLTEIFLAGCHLLYKLGDPSKWRQHSSRPVKTTYLCLFLFCHTNDTSIKTKLVSGDSETWHTPRVIGNIVWYMELCKNILKRNTKGKERSRLMAWTVNIQQNNGLHADNDTDIITPIKGKNSDMLNFNYRHIFFWNFPIYSPNFIRHFFFVFFSRIKVMIYKHGSEWHIFSVTGSTMCFHTCMTGTDVIYSAPTVIYYSNNSPHDCPIPTLHIHTAGSSLLPCFHCKSCVCVVVWKPCKHFHSKTVKLLSLFLVILHQHSCNG